MALATTSLPTPLSPVIITGACERETRPIILNTPCIAGAFPMKCSLARVSGSFAETLEGSVS